MKLIDVFEGLMRVFWLWIWEVDKFLLDIFLVDLLKYVLIDIKKFCYNCFIKFIKIKVVKYFVYGV